MLIILIIFLPLVSFFIDFYFNKYIGKNTCDLLTGIIFFSLILSLYKLYLNIRIGGFFNVFYYPWLSSSFFMVNWSFNIDSLTILLIILINFMSLLVHSYLIDNREKNPDLFKFFPYISLATFFLIIFLLCIRSSFTISFF